VSGALFGTAAFAALRLLPILVRHPPLARLISALGRPAVVAFTQTAVVFVGFLIASVLGVV
jgi:hypothetical protein